MLVGRVVVVLVLVGRVVEVLVHLGRVVVVLVHLGRVGALGQIVMEGNIFFIRYVSLAATNLLLANIISIAGFFAYVAKPISQVHIAMHDLSTQLLCYTALTSLMLPVPALAA